MADWKVLLTREYAGSPDTRNEVCAGRAPVSGLLTMSLWAIEVVALARALRSPAGGGMQLFACARRMEQARNAGRRESGDKL